MQKAEQVALAKCLARVCAAKAFARSPDREDLVNDAESYAWQYAMSAPDDVDPRAIVRFALRRVKSDRRFDQSKRDVNHPRNRETHPRVAYDLEQCFAVGANPAKIVQVKVDWEAWLASLPKLHRQIALQLATGSLASDIAAELGRSASRISQIRTELRLSWQRFIGG